uniref:Putative secreted protein n=1 Tax=Anopheles darlingi TaxID=43151 RepID=A0A2M4D2C7_ANODA
MSPLRRSLSISFSLSLSLSRFDRALETPNLGWIEFDPEMGRPYLRKLRSSFTYAVPEEGISSSVGDESS